MYPQILKILALPGLSVFFSACAEHSDIPSIAATPVEVTTVHFETAYTAERAFIGQIEAGRKGPIGFEISGTLIDLEVNAGDTVEAGTILARLDTARLEARENEARALVDEATAILALAEATRERMREARRLNAVSSQALDEAENAASAAAARLLRAQASAAVVAIDLDKSTLRSPYAAVIEARLADLGESLSPVQPILQLSGSRHREVRFSVPSSEASRLAIGQRLTFVAHDASGQGTLVRIRSAQNAATRAVEAFLKIDPSLAAAFRPETVVAVNLPIEVTVSGFWLQRTSLTEGTRGLWACFVPEPLPSEEHLNGATHRLTRVDLEWIHAEGDRVFVRGPLNDGDTVVSTGLQRLTPGLRVRLQGPPF